MTDDERLEQVLATLGLVLTAMYARGLGDSVVLIGAQVVAIERRARGLDANLLTLGTGDVIVRPFSLEPDLLHRPVDDGAQPDGLFEVLRGLGFTRVSSWRWRRGEGDSEVLIDVLAPRSDADADAATSIPAGEMTLARARRVTLWVGGAALEVPIPDPASYLRLKLDARAWRKPRAGKDSFDLFAYLKTVGAEEARRSLTGAPEGPQILAELRALFSIPTDAGVREVVLFAALYDSQLEAALERDVLDTFAALLGA
jgi:hypothetical protein